MSFISLWHLRLERSFIFEIESLVRMIVSNDGSPFIFHMRLIQLLSFPLKHTLVTYGCHKSPKLTISIYRPRCATSLTEWYVTYWSYVVLILLNQRSLSIKVMQLVLFRWRQVILNAIFCIKMVLFHRSYGHMNICKLSTCDNLEEIFTRSTILHISYV